jgi:colanic acid/amylovoran biosynthesis glycosyltransferase
MRIGYFTNQYPAPSHTFIRREILALEERGHDVVRYAVRPVPFPLVDNHDLQEAKRTRHVLRQPFKVMAASIATTLAAKPGGFLRASLAAAQFAHRAGHSYLRHLIYLAEATVLASWCRRDDIEHLHVHFGTNSATVACLARLMSDIKVSITVHGPEEFDRPERLGLKEKIALADFTVAVSSFGRSQLLRWARLQDWPKIHVIACGIDNHGLEPRDSEFPFEPRLVCIGRLSEQKGHLLLLQAVHRLVSKGLDIKLTLLGDGPLREVIERRVQELHLDHVVELTGTVSQERIEEELQRSRALVCPSFAEGLPVVLMESMALERPVIATYIAGIPELVRPDTGWLVPAGDVDALANSIEEVLRSDPLTLSRMGAAAKQRALARHDIRRSAAKLEDLIVMVGKDTAEDGILGGKLFGAALVPDQPMSDEILEKMRRAAVAPAFKQNAKAPDEMTANP